jgi:hypothetical protein
MFTFVWLILYFQSSSYEEGTERPHKSHVTFDSPHKSSVQKTDNKNSIKKNIDFGGENSNFQN